MAAYFVIEPKAITDAAGAAEYGRVVKPMVARWGGRYIARGQEVLEGDWHPNYLVIIEFDSMARLKEFYYSEEYTPLKELRQRSVPMNVVAVEGT